jgi:hypothetical protein
MMQHFYHERDYALGQVMLKLRSSIGLTQSVHQSCVLAISREKTR